MQGRSAQVARGLSTIAANIVKNKDALAEYGIEVELADGKLKSTYDVLSELSEQWDTMSDVERTALGDTLAGQNQYKVFAAVLQNFDTAVEATATAYNSAGSAAKENERSIDSLEGHTNNLKAAFEDLSNNVIPNELIKSLLDLATGFLNVANSGIGQFLIRFTLISTTVLGASTMFTQLAVKVLPMLKAAFVSAAGGAITLNAALGWISLAAGAITALILLAVDLQKKSDSLIPNLTREIEENTSQLETNKQRLEEINALPWYDRTPEIEKEKKALEEENEELDKNIKKRKEQKLEAARKATQDGTVTRSDRFYLTSDLSGTKPDNDKAYFSPEEAEAAAGDSLGVGTVITSEATYSTVINELEEYNQLLIDNRSLTAESNQSLLRLLADGKDAYDNLIIRQEQQDDTLTDVDRKFIATYEKVQRTLSLVKDEAKANVEAQQKSAQATVDAQQANAKWSKELISLKTTYPELAAGLYDVNGSLTDNAAQALKAAGSMKEFAEVVATIGVTTAQQELDILNNKIATNLALSSGLQQGMAGGSSAELQQLVRQRKETEFRLEIAKKQAEIIKSIDYSVKTGNTGNSTGDTTKTLTQAEKNLQAFRSQLAYFEHELAMGEINEEQYYYHLHDLMNMYLQDAENVETLWKYQEKIYKHSQEELQNYYQEQLDQQNALIDKINERFDAEIDGLEKSNDELEKQIEYEQLLEDMASAKAKKSLVFKNGAFQYVEDVDAISSAQNALRKYYRQQEVEQKKQNIEAARQRELYEPQQLVSRLEEIIKNIKGYATGTTYSAGGLSLVGEHGAELAVLSKGTGVIPADITKNLWAWGQTTPSALMSTVAGVNTQNGGIYFSGVTMSFPSVRNGNDAQSFMQSVVNLAYQRAYSRK